MLERTEVNGQDSGPEDAPMPVRGWHLYEQRASLMPPLVFIQPAVLLFIAT